MNGWLIDFMIYEQINVMDPPCFIINVCAFNLCHNTTVIYSYSASRS